jgi:hypothetical protein
VDEMNKRKRKEKRKLGRWLCGDVRDCGCVGLDGGMEERKKKKKEKKKKKKRKRKRERERKNEINK